MKHFIHSTLLTRAANVVVVGAGGTGSHVVNGLVQLDTAMRALGHPGGLRVTVVDDDTVSESNVGRQAFVWSDIGEPKARVLVNRLNQAFGLDWKARVERVNPDGPIGVIPDVVIGCVDTRTARHHIGTWLAETVRGECYWLDLGNRQDDGQIVLGEIPRTYGKRPDMRLPTIGELFPDAVDPSHDERDAAPTCSLAQALEHQNLFINRAMALHALNLLWQLIRHGGIDHHGMFVNLKSGRTAPLEIDPEVWKRFGYEAEQKPLAA